MWHQLKAIVLYEVKMQRRGRTLAIVVLTLCSMNVLYALVTVSGPNGGQLVKNPGGAFAATWTPIFILLSIILPAFVGDTLPKDRQLRVGNILESTPLSRGIYLAGKLLSVWLGLLAALLITLLFSTVWWMLFGVVEIGRNLTFIGICILPLFSNVGIAVLLAAGQPTRRRGIFVGILVSLATIFLLIISAGTTGSFWDTLNLPRSPILFYLTRFISDQPDQVAFPFPANPEGIALTISFALLELLLCWGVIGWWWSRQESK